MRGMLNRWGSAGVGACGVAVLGFWGGTGCGTGGGSSHGPGGEQNATGAGGSPAILIGTGGSGQAVGGVANRLGTGGQDGVGGGDLGPPVPRIENTEGSSVLLKPTTPLNSSGKCQGASVYCAGQCLATEGEASGKCTAVKLGLGQATSLALTTDALFYTASNTEILRLDLAQGTHRSLVRGLDFVWALVVDGTILYFSTKDANSFFKYDVRGIGVAGGDVTVLSTQQGATIKVIVPLPDRLLFGVGDFDFSLFTVPKAGGAASNFGGITKATTPVLGGTTLYYRTDKGIFSTDLNAPMPDHPLNREFSNGTLMLEGDYLYHVISRETYSRTPIIGGPTEELQKVDMVSVWGRTSTQVILGRIDTADPGVEHVLAMPITGGTPTELTTVESGELRAVAGNATDLYLAVGTLHAGGLLRVKF